MQRAVRQVGTTDFGKIAMNYRSKSFGFYSRNYYAEFLAIAQLMRENQQKLQMIEQFPALQYEEVRLDSRMYINDITTPLSLSSEQLAELNRDLKNRVLQSKIPIPKHFHLKLPIGKKEEFVAMFHTATE
jgi:membrane-bound lytic murein transglycosylase D